MWLSLQNISCRVKISLLSLIDIAIIPLIEYQTALLHFGTQLRELRHTSLCCPLTQHMVIGTSNLSFTILDHFIYHAHNSAFVNFSSNVHYAWRYLMLKLNEKYFLKSLLRIAIVVKAHEAMSRSETWSMTFSHVV